ncbi:GntR family transcriptional regulator [Streptomyces sp. AM 2-1-1]|uniref:GntR family transcriptional regulator n=1 Tax=Streptomyces sp. AM 2-1-1 TaxID=3028709 RepID=UPI0023B968A5|nr:GntR family transcriptional regulator [Streptomyces sp. AM 2-1-1]WEH43986.1 GntR family transcriptional regulator [Streptomyces sp. AM 2-1-1]
MANTAKYLELAEELAARIQKGELAPGDRVSTVAELAHQYGVAHNTASRAVQTLKERGLLSGKPGGTTWVRVPPARTTRRNTRYQAEKDLVLRPLEERQAVGVAELDSGVPLAAMYEDQVDLDVVRASPEVAAALKIEAGSLVLRRIGRRRHRQRAGISTSVSYMPHDLASRNPELFDAENQPWPGGTQHQLHTLGVEVDKIVDYVTAVMPTDEEVAEQDIPPAVPVIQIRKVTYATTGQIVEVADIPLPADRSELIYETKLERW